PKSLRIKLFCRVYLFIRLSSHTWHKSCSNSVGLLSSNFFSCNRNFNGYQIMQISNVISGLADPTTWGKKSETASKAGANAVKSIESQVQASPALQKASVEILRHYDVTHITPEEFSQMVQKLHNAGALSEKDFQELSAVRGDLENAGVEPDESINILEFYSDKLGKAQKNLGSTLDDAARQQRLGPDLRRLDWMQKFAMIQANPDAVGLDMAA
ncbi:MAG: hypothetical protein ABSE63_14925, partial [Thermoguttaceae bacterium]